MTEEDKARGFGKRHVGEEEIVELLKRKSKDSPNTTGRDLYINIRQNYFLCI
jgi:hypothetical protein